MPVPFIVFDLCFVPFIVLHCSNKAFYHEKDTITTEYINISINT